MVGKWIRYMALLTLSTTALAGQGDGPPRVGKLLPKAVEITKNGAWTDRISGDEGVDFCRAFVLKTQDVREFFEKARRVSERQYGHDLPAARCYAEGEVTFSNGVRGQWEIDQARRGVVVMPDGTAAYLYCSRCRTKVFAPN